MRRLTTKFLERPPCWLIDMLVLCGKLKGDFMQLRNVMWMLGAWLALSGLGFAQPPTDNPVATFYDGPEGYPAWTDGIRWDRVIDMSQYAKGTTNFEKFENARDELAAQGGGVLYYPAGDYEFSQGPFDGPNGRGLMLRSGVVIRGDAPPKKPLAARDGTLPLKTKFVFGYQQKAGHPVPRDWNLIGLMPEKGKGVASVDNVGVAWVHVVGGVIYFGPELKWGETWRTAKSWKSDYAKPLWADRRPDGTHPMDPFMGAPGPENGGGYVGAGRGRLVFGCVLEKAALLNDYDTCGRKEAPEGFGPQGFHMAKFAGRISVYGSRVLVANNFLPPSDGNFLYEQTTVATAPGPRGGNTYRIGSTRTKTVMWDYNRTMGVDVNKDLLGMVQSAIWAAESGGYFEEGVVVADNWVFNHGHKGFNLSGKWLTIRGNRNERMFLEQGKPVLGVESGWTLTLDGFIESCAGGGGMISDNLSRAFDLAGANLWVHANSYNNTGSNPGNDGEGIVCQAHGGTYVNSWAITRNHGVGRGGGRGYILSWAVPVRGFLIAFNEVTADVGATRAAVEEDALYVGNKCVKVQGKGGQNLPEGRPAAPNNVKAEPYQGDAVKISWTDVSDNEIGFRVQRSSDGGRTWTTIAYRPPQIDKSPANPPEWVDFLAPPGKKLIYRVVALSIEDDDASASNPTLPVELPLPAKS
jgi:hypothetical protein